jgi:UDP-N-acetylglucosamine--N-acetylmuramyl-(pentapeptide) pyrophosphoryl-undecaprenol N-acetylglucosamine transferase
MGSYSSLAPVLAAKSAGVPVVLHEANTVPGRAVEFLSRYAKAVAISFEDTSRYLPSVKTVHTGLPVRAGISQGKRFDFIPAGSFVVFITGGSQGAHAVNDLVTDAVLLLHKTLEARGKSSRPLYVIHQTGGMDEGRVIAAYLLKSIPSRVKAFEDRMADSFASADFVIARAGASTCFELAECKKPALFIPLPSALRNHQHFNAEAFVKKGAADEAIQDKLTAHNLCHYILSKYDAGEKLEAMADKMGMMSIPDAAKRVADLVEKCVEKC